MRCRYSILIAMVFTLTIVGCSSKTTSTKDSPTSDSDNLIQVINPDSTLGLLTNEQFKKANDYVQESLWDRDLLEWADELNENLDSANAKQLCISLEVFTRACQPERINLALRRLGQCKIEYQLDPNLTEKISKREFWDSLQVFYETLPINPHCYWDMAVPQYLEKTQGRESARRWLKKQIRKSSLPFEPDKKRWIQMGGSGNSTWQRVYMKMLDSWGEMPEELARLEKEIRKSPSDLQLMNWYIFGRDRLAPKDRPSVAWIPKVVTFNDAIAYWRLVQSLYRGDNTPTEDARVAAWLYEQALRIPLTKEQRETLGEIACCSMRIEPQKAQATFTQWLKAGLPELYVRSNQLDKAQKLIEELTGSKDGTLKDIAAMQYQDAGMVQRASGKRVVEGRIKEAEALNKDSIDYWLKRAAYYAGRKKLKEQEKAYLIALSLPDNPDEFDTTMNSRRIPKRFRAVRDYQWFLEKQKRFADLEVFLRKEIQREGIASQHYRHFIELIGKPGVKCTWEDPMIWEAIRQNRKAGNIERAYDLVGQLAYKYPGPDWHVREAKLIECLGETPPPKLQWSLGETLYHQWYEYYRLSEPERAKAPKPIKTTRNEAIDIMLAAYKRLPDTPDSDKASKRVRLIKYLFLNQRPKEAITLVEQIESENDGRLPALARKEWYAGGDGAGPWIAWALASDQNELAMEWLRTAVNFDIAGGYTRQGGYRGPMTENIKAFYRNLLKRSPKNPIILGIIESIEEVENIQKGIH